VSDWRKLSAHIFALRVNQPAPSVLSTVIRPRANTPHMTIVENSAKTRHVGGVTGRGFLPGQSGNPGGRPRGLARRVRELVGDDGDEIVRFMFETMRNSKARMADRIEAARWLGDRGFGRSVQPIDLDVNQPHALNLSDFSIEDLEALLAIVDKYAPNVADIAKSGAIPFARRALEPPHSRQREPASES